jgi:hypothetical protein
VVPIPLLPISCNPTIPFVPRDLLPPLSTVLECTRSFVLVCGPRSRFFVAQQSAEVGGDQLAAPPFFILLLLTIDDYGDRSSGDLNSV